MQRESSKKQLNTKFSSSRVWCLYQWQRKKKEKRPEKKLLKVKSQTFIRWRSIVPITSSHPAGTEQKVLSKTRTAKCSSLTRFTGQCTQMHTKEIIMPLSIQVPSRKIISTVSTVTIPNCWCSSQQLYFAVVFPFPLPCMHKQASFWSELFTL